MEVCILCSCYKSVFCRRYNQLCALKQHCESNVHITTLTIPTLGLVLIPSSQKCWMTVCIRTQYIFGRPNFVTKIIIYIFLLGFRTHFMWRNIFSTHCCALFAILTSLVAIWKSVIDLCYVTCVFLWGGEAIVWANCCPCSHHYKPQV